MGNNCSSSSSSSSSSSTSFASSSPPKYIADNFKTFKEVQIELRKNGLEQCNLIIGIDCTKSNLWQGQKTNAGRSLHDVSSEKQTPYEKVLQCIATTLEEFDDDNLIPLYGFGDAFTNDSAVFNFQERAGRSGCCNGLAEALSLYRAIIPGIRLSGPTSFAPIIQEAIRVVKAEGGFHILIIIADGAVNSVDETVNAIVEASDYALSIVVIGVGDGPWDLMEKFDDNIPTRKFDNLQFVNATQIFNNYHFENPETYFAMNALMEVPTQYKYLKEKGVIKNIQRHQQPAAVKVASAYAGNLHSTAPPPY